MSLARLVFNLIAIEFWAFLAYFHLFRHLQVIQLFKKHAKTFYFQQAFQTKKTRLKIGLQVSKSGFSPIVMQCHDIQWYFALFCASKKWRLLAQVSRTSDHDSSVQPREELHRPKRVEQKSFSSRKCRFPRPSLVAAIIFPHKKWLPKITDYRDTAALINQYEDDFKLLGCIDAVHKNHGKCNRITWAKTSVAIYCSQIHAG